MDWIVFLGRDTVSWQLWGVVHKCKHMGNGVAWERTSTARSMQLNDKMPVMILILVFISVCRSMITRPSGK